MRRLALFSLLLLAACAPATAEGRSLRPIDWAIRRAVAYLEAEHHRAAFGLLPESPVARPNKHWLATDNQLAVYALRAAGQEFFAAQLERAMQRWNAPPHGIIEALAGEPIAWPPYPEAKYVAGSDPSQETSALPNICSELKDAPEPVVCYETRNEQKSRFMDWAEYADLALYGALNECNQGNSALAHAYYWRAMALFNGMGFADKAYRTDTSNLYTTYKLALALYVGARLGKPPSDKVLFALLSQQNEAGGFVSLYDSRGISQGDSNTETTSYALLALATIREGRAGDSRCPQGDALTVFR